MIDYIYRMNLRDLHYFVAVADEGHFGRAADVCHVSQPTLSMQVKKLEEFLGVRLFERARKKVMVTSAGQDLLPLARQILHNKDQMVDRARDLQDPLAGVLRLGGFPTLSPYLFPRIVPPMIDALPKIKWVLVEEKTSVLIEKLLSGALDAALMAVPVAQDAFDHVDLFSDPFYLAVSKKRKLAQRAKISPHDLVGEDLLLLEDGHCLRDQALAVCDLAQARGSDQFRGTSLETLRQMVVADAGMTLIPKIAVRDDERVQYVPFAGAGAPSRTIGLFWRRGSGRQILFDKIADVIKAVM